MNVNVALIWTTFHDDRLAPFPFDGRAVRSGIDAAHDPCGARGHAEVSANHEPNTSEHLLLFDLRNSSEGCADAVHKVLIGRAFRCGHRKGWIALPNVRHERRRKGREASFGTSARWRG